MEEIWKKLIYQGIDYGDYYEVSNLGRIRNSKTKYVRKNCKMKNGYYKINASINGVNKTIKIHRAVAESFIPNPFNKPQINHIDGNKENNNIENLEWVTQTENIKHAYKNDLISIPRGEDRSNSKLKIEDVIYIRKNYFKNSKEFNMYKLAEKFNVSVSTINDIIKEKSWKDIGGR